MKVEIIKISTRFLERAMNLPSGTAILKARQSWENEKNQEAELLVQSDNLKEVAECQTYPEALLLFQSEYCEHCRNTYVVKSEFQQS